jgi:hypothetical protein
VYDAVCHELAGSVLREPRRNRHSQPSPIMHIGTCHASIVKNHPIQSPSKALEVYSEGGSCLE